MTVSLLVCVLLVGSVTTVLLVRQDEIRAWQAIVVALTGFLLALTPVGDTLKNVADQVTSSSSHSTKG